MIVVSDTQLRLDLSRPDTTSFADARFGMKDLSAGHVASCGRGPFHLSPRFARCAWRGVEPSPLGAGGMLLLADSCRSCKPNMSSRSLLRVIPSGSRFQEVCQSAEAVNSVCGVRSFWAPGCYKHEIMNSPGESSGPYYLACLRLQGGWTQDSGKVHKLNYICCADSL